MTDPRASGARDAPVREHAGTRDRRPGADMPGRVWVGGAGVAVLTVGLVVLAGWATGDAALKSLAPSFSQMKANTALGFVLSGSALALIAAGQRRAAAVLGGLVVALGTLTFLEHVTVIDLGIDQLLVHDQDRAVATPAPGRMGLTTSFAFALSGTALTVTALRPRRLGRWSRPSLLATGASVAAFVIAFLALLGYLYDVPRDTTTLIGRSITPMALHTAGAFIVLSVGTLFADPTTDIARLARSPRAGGTLIRRLLLAVVTVPAVLGLIAQLASRAGLQGNDQRLALVVTATTVVFGALVWTTARTLEDTDRERAESNAREVAVLAATLDAVITLDGAGRVLSFNTVAEGMFGYASADAIGRTLGELIVPEELVAAHEHGLRHPTAVGPERPLRRLETVAQRKDGSRFPIEVAVSRITGAGPAAFVGNVRDITERHEMAERLRHAQKLEAVGQLAGGVAHDFNNFLAVIDGFARQAAAEVGDGPASADLAEIIVASERAARVTGQLLAFSRRQPLRPEQMNLSEVVRAITPMIRRLIGDDITVTTDIDDAGGTIEADRGQVEQVILNLAVNARDAMPGGGELTVGTSTRAVDDHAELADGDYVELWVSDTGAGIDPEVMERMFEPFFTTKAVGEGTGLGLATVHGIVSQSGGLIEATCPHAGGTRFTVLLPRIAASAADAADEQPAEPRRDSSASAGAGRTILVCEDEPALRRLLDRILTRAGYTVIAKGRPWEAVRWAAQRDELALLCTDVVLPEMSGIELARQVRELHPAARLLFMSGYPADALRRDGGPPPDAVMLAKPFEVDHLLTAIEALLDGATDSPRGR